MRSRAFNSALFWGLFFGSLCIVAVVMPAAAATPGNFAAAADNIALRQTGEAQASHLAAMHFCAGWARSGPHSLIASPVDWISRFPARTCQRA